MNTLITIVMFLFGSVIGSFLNVVILRYRTGRSVGGRSACFSCDKKLSWYELVPIASFATQRGKCTGCQARISWQYPIVEAITGILFVLLYARFAYLLPTMPLLFGILFAYYAFIASVLVVLSAYDMRHKILPDGLTMLFAGAAFVGMFFLKGDALILHVPGIWDLCAGILLPAPFALIWLISKGKWMGLGDAKLMIGIGFLLGMSGGITAVLLSFWIGAAFSIMLLILGGFVKRGGVFSMKMAIPFGPFLALSTLLAVIWQLDLGFIAQMFGGSF
jgi:leader peptidase (prepilin peptidase)/N-methyltransferase